MGKEQDIINILKDLIVHNTSIREAYEELLKLIDEQEVKNNGTSN